MLSLKEIYEHLKAGGSFLEVKNDMEEQTRVREGDSWVGRDIYNKLEMGVGYELVSEDFDKLMSGEESEGSAVDEPVGEPEGGPVGEPEGEPVGEPVEDSVDEVSY